MRTFVLSLLLGLAAATGTLLQGQSTVIQPREGGRRVETRTLSLPAGARLEVNSQVGRITVEGWDRSDVELRAEFRSNRHGDQVKLTIDPRSDALVIRTEKPSEHGWWIFRGNAECRLELRVPRQVVARLTTEVGSIRVQGVRGPLDLRTEVGSIEARGLEGLEKGLRAETEVGSIRISLGGVRGKLRADTEVGSIQVRTPGISIDRQRRGHLEATLGQGGQAIVLATEVGSIHVD
jgi:hypothetical protein